MSLRHFLIGYPVTAVIFLALDACWLTLTAERIYRPALGHLMADTFHFAPAAIFYPAYVVGIVVFAVMPALESGRWSTALGLGALFGLLAYATYDLTNQATLKDWPVMVTMIDLSWGTFSTAAAATAGWWLTGWISDALASR